MQWKKFIYPALLCASWALPAFAKNRMAQLVFAFPTPREFFYDYQELENTLTLEIKNTGPQELKPIEQYDEALIRRILIKDLGRSATQVDFVLRDRNVRAVINKYYEPFRIVIDFFDKDYKLVRDPITGLPIHRFDTDIEIQSPAFALASPQTGSFDDGAATNNNNLAASNPSSGDLAIARQTPPTTTNKRLLMQPVPKLFNDPGELQDAMTQVDPGVGKYWQQYPPYIFRLQTVPYQTDKHTDDWYKSQATKAMSSAEAMADYASKLFDLGQENRALQAYSQVLYKDPRIFDRHAPHLWKLAEIHLGQANLTLADGYFQSFATKHAENPLAPFAAMRRLDIRALRAIERKDTTEFGKLATAVNAIPVRSNSELTAQLNIRKAYWSNLAQSEQAAQIGNNNFIPLASSDISTVLQGALAKVESPKTSFLASTIIMNEMLHPRNKWENATSKFAGEYFQRFTGKTTEPFRSTLMDNMVKKFNQSTQEKVLATQYLSAIQDLEGLPQGLKAIEKDPTTSWSLAEAYRRIGQPQKAIQLYADSARNTNEGPDRFKAQFWTAVLAGSSREDLINTSQNPSQVSNLGNLWRDADESMAHTWEALKEKERSQLVTAMRQDLEQTLTSPTLLKTPPKILLSVFEKQLGKTTADATDLKANQSGFSPSANTVYLLSNLAKRFGDLGMSAERRKTLALLKQIPPAQIADKPEAKKLWSQELLGLANEYRKDNDYLEAGRTFALAGEQGSTGENRAESLYKSGLLLYRAGQREEALKSFKECSEDGNNRYYANLCSERLERLNNQ